MKGFLNNLYLRPSCGSCSFKNQKSGADITLADFWTVYRYIPIIKDHDKGVSLLLVEKLNNEKMRYLNDTIRYIESSYAIALKVNPSIEHCAKLHKNNSKFFEKFEDGYVTKVINESLARNVIEYIHSFSKRIIYKLKYELSKL